MIKPKKFSFLTSWHRVRDFFFLLLVYTFSLSLWHLLCFLNYPNIIISIIIAWRIIISSLTISSSHLYMYITRKGWMGIAMWDREGAGVEDKLCVHKHTHQPLDIVGTTMMMEKWQANNNKYILWEADAFCCHAFFYLLLHFHLVAHFNLQEHGSSVYKHKPFPPTSQFIIVVVVLFTTSLFEDKVDAEKCRSHFFHPPLLSLTYASDVPLMFLPLPFS